MDVLLAFSPSRSRPIVRIDTTKLDYVEDLVDLIELQQKLDRVLR